jgi:hypothetical protein
MFLLTTVYDGQAVRKYLSIDDSDDNIALTRPLLEAGIISESDRRLLTWLVSDE